MNWQRLLDDVHGELRPALGRGKVASYIPALANADPQAFAIALATLDGQLFTTGCADAPFSAQSITKVFMLSLALEAVDADLWKRVGREPSGSAFNSIMQLEREQGIPRNPFINAGALVVTDTVLSACTAEDALTTLLALVRRLAGSERVRIDDAVAASERSWGHRNASLAHFMKSFGVIENDVERVLETYFCQCALEVTPAELARAGRFLANGGLDPASGAAITSPARARRIAALMMTCGHYDMSGDFAFRVGLPGKSGVGGGILCIIPEFGAIVAYSPPLNTAGNSLAGTDALERIAAAAGLNVFGGRPDGGRGRNDTHG